MHILVVDDSKAMRMIVRRTLRLAGFRVEITEAPDAEQALQMLKNQQIDLVLCDWNMPGTTGLELMEKIRSAGNKVKFGFVTTECSVEMRTAASNAGALFMITKPFTADTFQKTLAPLIG